MCIYLSWFLCQQLAQWNREITTLATSRMTSCSRNLFNFLFALSSIHSALPSGHLHLIYSLLHKSIFFITPHTWEEGQNQAWDWRLPKNIIDTVVEINKDQSFKWGKSMLKLIIFENYNIFLKKFTNYLKYNPEFL